MFKKCTKCELDKSIDEFTTKTGNVTARCLDCKREISKLWAKNNKERLSVSRKKLYHADIEESRRKQREESARFRKNNPEKKSLSNKKWHEKYRDRILEETRVKNKKRYVQMTVEEKLKRKEQTDSWKNDNPEKVKEYSRKGADTEREKCVEEVSARKLLYYAVKSGRIKRPTACVKCEIECKPEAHHPDYSKPLDVIFLCRKCHMIEHEKLKITPNKEYIECQK